MSDKPILFSGPMVRAIFDDRKTETRRVLNPQPFERVSGFQKVGTDTKTGLAIFESRDVFGKPSHAFKQGKHFVTPYAPVKYAVSDRLYVRENFAVEDGSSCGCSEAPCGCPQKGEVMYKATQDSSEIKWKPSIHMPKAFSRIWLEVVGVKVERLQDINWQDAIAEGVESARGFSPSGMVYRDYQCSSFLMENALHSPIDSFKSLWNSLNAKPKPRYGKDESGKKIITHFESYPWGKSDYGSTYRGKLHIIYSNPWIVAYSYEREK